ncbi:helix-turn-helix domain-containing protein [Legionella geestiana]|nr:helix-turn-helix domain-containing protein [Legionella geestiana]
MTLSDNLQHLMRIHGNISVSELARLTMLPQPTVHHLLTGFTKNPRKKTLEALSQFFSVSIQQLLGEEALPTQIPDTLKNDLDIGTVPLIEWDMLPDWPKNEDTLHATNDILLGKRISPHSFALIARDKSLEPAIPHNALLIFDAGKTPQNWDFVVVCMGKDNAIMLNSLFQDGEHSYLKQEQKDGDARLIRLDLERDRILGTLIEARIVYSTPSAVQKAPHPTSA